MDSINYKLKQLSRQVKVHYYVSQFVDDNLTLSLAACILKLCKLDDKVELDTLVSEEPHILSRDFLEDPVSDHLAYHLAPSCVMHNIDPIDPDLHDLGLPFSFHPLYRFKGLLEAYSSLSCRFYHCLYLDTLQLVSDLINSRAALFNNREHPLNGVLRLNLEHTNAVVLHHRSHKALQLRLAQMQHGC